MICVLFVCVNQDRILSLIYVVFSCILITYIYSATLYTLHWGLPNHLFRLVPAILGSVRTVCPVHPSGM